MRLGLRLLPAIALSPALGLGASRVRAQPGLQDVGFVLGDTAAPVKVIEFGDFGCWECADIREGSWSRIRRDLIDAGREAWRYLPGAQLPLAGRSLPAGVAFPLGYTLGFGEPPPPSLDDLFPG